MLPVVGLLLYFLELWYQWGAFCVVVSIVVLSVVVVLSAVVVSVVVLS